MIWPAPRSTTARSKSFALIEPAGSGLSALQRNTFAPSPANSCSAPSPSTTASTARRRVHRPDAAPPRNVEIWMWLGGPTAKGRLDSGAGVVGVHVHRVAVGAVAGDRHRVTEFSEPLAQRVEALVGAADLVHHLVVR